MDVPLGAILSETNAWGISSLNPNCNGCTSRCTGYETDDTCYVLVLILIVMDVPLGEKLKIPIILSMLS